MNDEQVDKLNDLTDFIEEKYGEVKQIIINISHSGSISTDDRYGEIESIEIVPLENVIKIYNKNK